MTNEEIRKEVKEKVHQKYQLWKDYTKQIDNKLANDNPCSHDEIYKATFDGFIDQILSLSGDDWELAIVRKNPELPECPYENYQGNDPVEIGEYNRHNGYVKCQQDMLKAGFRQEVK